MLLSTGSTSACSIAAHEARQIHKRAFRVFVYFVGKNSNVPE